MKSWFRFLSRNLHAEVAIYMPMSLYYDLHAKVMIFII